MGKKCLCLIMSMLLILSTVFLSLSVFAKTSDKTIKKIASIVYDDSGSMKDNEKYAYASYSLQNLVSLMNGQDEMNVVKMSSPNNSISIDLATNDARQNCISSIAGYGAKGSTPFAAVDTAANWLKSRKSDYGDSQSVEYWLVVITDGQFENMPDFTSYLNGLKEAMGSSKYEGIFVAIGNDLQQNVINIWNSITGNHFISAVNSEQIVNAMSEVSGLILGQGGKESKVEVSMGQDGKSLNINSAFPLKKFIVYEQNQNVGITSVSANGMNIGVSSDFSSKQPGNVPTNARAIHCMADEFIPAGDITVNFENPIDTSSNKLKILTDSAVNVKFTVLDKSGNQLDLEKANLAEGDYVEFAAVVTSCIDDSPINLKNWAEQASAELIVNEQKIAMQYNAADNTFYGGFNIVSGSNMAYSIVTLPGYFRAKSDVINIYPMETINNASASVSSSILEVPYKYCSNYEEVGKFEYTVSGGRINGICNFEFKNLPKGIKASVNGVETDKDGKISLKIHNDVPADVAFLRNKDFKEVEENKISINVTSDQYVLKWATDSITEIILKPVKRAIKFEVKEEKSKIKLNEINNSVIYTVAVLANDEYLSKEELSTVTFEFSKIAGLKFEKEIVKGDGHYLIKISPKKSFISLFVKTGDIKSEMSATTVYFESGKTDLNLNIIDSATKFIFPLLLLLLLIAGIGYLPGVKKRIANKKYCFSVDGAPEQILVNSASRFLPYAPEKGFASILSLKATNRRDKIEILDVKDGENTVLLNDEDQSDESHICMRPDDVLKIKDDKSQSTYIFVNSNDDDSFEGDFGDLGDDNLFDDDNSSKTDDSDDSIF